MHVYFFFVCVKSFRFFSSKEETIIYKTELQHFPVLKILLLFSFSSCWSANDLRIIMDLLSQFQFSSDNRGGATVGTNSFISTNYNTNPQQPHVLDHPRLIRSITIDRCSNFTSGGANGNDVNLLSQLYKAKTNSGLNYISKHIIMKSKTFQ